MRSHFLVAKTYVDKTVNFMQVVMFLIIFTVVMAQIIWRYGLDNPISWSEELSRYLFIWISLIGWSQATRGGHNIRITIIEEKLPPVLRLPLNILFKLMTAAYLCLLIYLGALMAQRYWTRPSVAVPWFTAGLVYLALPIGATFCLFYTSLDILFPVRREKPEIMD
ncbi:MAG: TRAP transporter small permease [Planctomycetota bacterium]|nr:TRAP transporter small permease [Planctomycetota bacterium]